MSAAVSETPSPVAKVAARLRIKPVSPAFADAVLSDLLRMRETSTGRALFNRVRTAGRLVTIEKPNPPTDPPNAWSCLRHSEDTGAAEIVIVYDPGDWPNPAMPHPLPSDAVLFAVLEDALADEATTPESRAASAYLSERRDAASPPSQRIGSQPA
jgi:hypothetical protein